MSSYFQVLYMKDGNVEDIEIPARIILHRVALFTPKYLEYCYRMSKYVDYVDDTFILKHLNKVIERHIYPPKTKEIKEAFELQKQKKEKNSDELLWLYELICQHYKWGIREIEMYKNYYYELFRVNNKLLYFFQFYGVQESIYKKYKLI